MTEHKHVRRVVTGHDADGKAVFVSDEHVAPLVPSIAPQSSFHRLWGGDAAPKYPDDGAPPPHDAYFPPVGGFRFGLFTLPPDGAPPPPDGFDYVEGLAELERMLPGLAGHVEVADPGMHTTATIDFELVLSGEVQLELDDGSTVRLQTGDTVVQNGTRHRWSNPGAEAAVLAVFMCGAHHERVGS